MYEKTIAITGSEGYLGRMVRHRLEDRFRIRRIDTNCPNKPECCRADVRLQEDAERAIDGCDLVIHLAAIHGGYSPGPTQEARYEANVTGAFRVLQACVKKDIGRMVFGSSISVQDVSSFYGLTKRLGEELCLRYHESDRMRIVMLRYGAFTPCDVVTAAERLLSYGVDVRDCVEATAVAVDRLMADQVDCIGCFVTPNYGLPPREHRIDRAWIDRLLQEVPGAGRVIERYDLAMPERVRQYDLSTTKDALGFLPAHDFASHLAMLQQLDESGVLTPTSPRWTFETGVPAPEGAVLTGLDPANASRTGRNTPGCLEAPAARPAACDRRLKRCRASQ